MKRWISTIIILIFTLLSPIANAQMAVGSWRTHLSYYGAHSVVAAPDYVYAASDNAVIFYDRNSHDVDTWSKVEGLTSTGINHIFYDQDSRYLIVIYNDANLDFIRDGKLTNVPDIKNKAMTGEKRINSATSHNGLIYLACSFGVVTIDPSTLLILDTWYTQLGASKCNTNSIQIFNNQYFITTSEGIFKTAVNSNSIADFSTWQRVTEMPTGEYSESCIFHEQLYVTRHFDDDHDTLYIYDGNSWRKSSIDLCPIRALDAHGDTLLVATWSFGQLYDTSETMIGYYGSDSEYDWQNIRDACFDGHSIWYADAHNGLRQIALDWSINQLYTINGPFASSAFAMDYANGVLAMAPGAITATWGKAYQGVNLSYFTNEEWRSVLQKDNSGLYGLYDLTSVAVNPRNPSEIYGGIFEGGVVKYSEWEVEKIYNRSNFPLYSFDSSEAYIGGMCFDDYGNLWVSNCYSNLPLAVLKTDGSWTPFPLSSITTGFSTSFGDIIVDSRGYKWIVMPRASNSIAVFDDHRTIDDRSDDHVTSINMNAAANIETSTVNCIVEDKKGQIWIGCNLGIKIIYNPGQVFEGKAYPQNLLVEQDDYVQNLFEFEEVTCIAVDDANRKWVGTAKSGVFLISDDGKDELLHFTEENSPLLSNRIYKITIQRETGEVFFATANGLISYRGTATEGKEDYSEVKVFPNPVRESYHGVITVSGLKANSFCKVADAAGNLIWQDYANGGTFTWDGKDFYGNRPATGVYFVFASDEAGKKKKVAKILFIH